MTGMVTHTPPAPAGPAFAGDDRHVPPRIPESPATRWRIRVSAVLALVAGTAYLVWRLVATLNGDALALSLGLWWLELHALLGLGLFTFSLWDVDATPRPTAKAPDLRVAVLVPTYDEPLEILLPTIAAAVALEPAHETWVLDDGDRPHVAAMATELGARYLTRPEHVHAKAGNLNHALSVVEADIVGILDADHVARPGFLKRTLPYFSDPDVALVQTPQDFYNESSFEHVHGPATSTGEQRIVFTEQSVFYREIQPGKDRWNGAFWCGTGALVRTTALTSVGGVATSSITEDIQTTIRLHRDGWRTIYHDEVLARGLAASTAAQYSLQRHRWCTGAMQVLREERPITDRRLSVPQRLSYAATLLGWFDALRILGFLMLPPAVLLSGASPISAPLGIFALCFLTALLLQQHALWQLARGRLRPVPAAIFDLVRLEATLGAIFSGLTGRAAAFAVTPKGRTGQPRVHAPTPRLLASVLAIHVVAAAGYVATVAGIGPLSYAVPGVAHGAAFWLLINGSLVGLAIRRVRAERFAAERRSSHRHRLRTAGALDGRDVLITDLSITGAQALAATADVPAIGSPTTLTIALDGGVTTFDATVRSVRPDDTGAGTDGTATVGLEFVTGQLSAQAQLTLGLFAAGSQRRDELIEAI